MKKEELLKQEDVPQIIKDIVANMPEDADIEVTKLGVTANCEDRRKRSDVSYPDGLDIFPYLSTMEDVACKLLDMTDKDGRINKDDVKKALGYIDCISGTVSNLYSFLCD